MKTPMQMLACRIPKKELRAISRAAKLRGWQRSRFIREALARFVQQTKENTEGNNENA